jgi:hypothetical protein
LLAGHFEDSIPARAPTESWIENMVLYPTRG